MTNPPPAETESGKPPSGEPVNSDIRTKIAKGVGWTVLTRLSIQGIGIISILIMARLLVPEDFGLVALATTFSGALMALSEFGFDTVLIQNQKATRRHYDTAWTMSVIRNAVLAIALVIGAEYLAVFFEDARLETIVYWLALGVFISGFENIGVVDFRKDLTFHKDMIFMAGGRLGMFFVTIPLAFIWGDYWALVAGIVATGIVKFILSFVMHSFRPRFDLIHWREIMHFSKWLVLHNIIGFAYHRADTFVIGKIMGASSVGLYSMALEISQMATANLVAPLRRALFPAYSKLSSDLVALKENFVDIFAIVMLVGTPIALGIGLVAEPMVYALLGSNWLEAIPLLQILSIHGFLSIIGAGSGPVYLAMARPYYLAWFTGAGCVLLIPLMIIGTTNWGAVGAAWALTATTALVITADFIMVLRLLKMSVARLFTRAWRPVIAALAMAAVVIEVQLQWPAPESSAEWLALLCVGVLAGALVYTSSIVFLWWITGCKEGAEQHLLTLFRKATASLFSARAVLRKRKESLQP